MTSAQPSALFPVFYSDDLYDLTNWAEKLAAEDRGEFNPDTFLLTVLHKSNAWKYEDEWRLVRVTDTVEPDHNLAVPTPSRLFLGSKMVAAKKKELIKLSEAKHIEVHQMRLANDRFELLADRVV